jgi:secondary thiamine-phosphate synthase enzyme
LKNKAVSRHGPISKGKKMKCYTTIVEIELATGPAIEDITADFNQAVRASGIRHGLLAANVIGSTGSLTTIEYEPGVIQDLKDAIERIAPRDIPYQHELAWHDGNGHSHVQAALLGPSMSISIQDGRLMLGTWQQAVVINHDNKARRRKIAVTIIGE